MIVILFLVSFIIGSIPFGYIFGKFFKNIDIRNYGSKNIGATNVGRVMGWKFGIVVLILDIFKGILPTWLGLVFSYELNSTNPIHISFFAGIFAILGHVYSPWIQFKGGKGIATALGVCLTLLTIPTLASLFVFFLIYKLSRYISLGSIVAGNLLPVFYYLFYKINWIENYSYLIQFILVALGFFILYTHRENIIRLYRGEELLP